MISSFRVKTVFLVAANISIFAIQSPCIPWLCCLVMPEVLWLCLVNVLKSATVFICFSKGWWTYELMREIGFILVQTLLFRGDFHVLLFDHLSFPFKSQKAGNKIPCASCIPQGLAVAPPRNHFALLSTRFSCCSLCARAVKLPVEVGSEEVFNDCIFVCKYTWNRLYTQTNKNRASRLSVRSGLF